ncbi:outer membrane beta-barrel protein [Rhodoferax aquaticus]|uniref:TIGR03016 family PEP-CTERM system-associated outer membrane protein n=1 Tax=Rhodoferax aquaticus TaxID=2527691 RepID=A0A515EPF6_9BURK|nr:outer membrane beta-barrel protein [Rhodoferax aquaticus]QDL54543.1 hypothetical protein EXZ61_10405 [Rhodoferax aquaticus]
MRRNALVVCLAAVLPFGFVSAALAQSVPAPSADQPGDAGYTLKSSTLKAPAPSAQPANATSYELSGTSISGASSLTPTILTAPVYSAAPFKTESGLYLYPSLFTGVGYNNNLARTETNAVGSSFLTVAPQLVAEMKNKGDRYTVLAAVNSTSYNSSSDDNSTNGELTLAGDNYFSSRARMGWSLGHVNSSDPRGSTARANNTKPDNWHSTNANGTFIYGAPEASGRLEFDVGSQAKVYDSNRATTAAADVNITSLAGRVFYRLGTRSLALVELRNAKNAYVQSGSTASNTENRYYAGLTWDATAATTGIVKVGQMRKDFDTKLAGRDNFTGGSWEGTLRWAPLTYSVVDFQTSRATADASGVGNFLLTTGNDVVWNHKWTQSLTSRVSVGTLSTEFVGDAAARKDNANSYGLSLNYAVLRWLQLGVDLSGTDSSSNSANASFKRNVTMFTLNASL